MGMTSDTPTLLLSAVHEVNQYQRRWFFDKIVNHFDNNLSGRRIAVWGIAFKPGTDDVREAPAITLMEMLLDKGASIVAYDPVATETCPAVMGDRIRYTEDAIEATEGAEALVVCTDWSEFKYPDFEELKSHMARAVIFDGRNLYRCETMDEHGFTHYSVGRKAVNDDRLGE